MSENTFQFCWFQREADASGEVFHPQPVAQALWREDQLHGVAISGLLARAMEQRVTAQGHAGFVPARYQVDMYRPARFVATTTQVDVVREGPRLLLLDAAIQQEGEVVARASGTFLKTSADPAGSVWSADPATRPTPPPAELLPPRGEHHVPLMASDAPWSSDFTQHQNGGRHQTWQSGIPACHDEECTPFQAVASIADATSMVCNWGSGGVEYINTDIGLTLSRLPVDTGVGLRALDHLSTDGVAIGVAEVFDTQGVFGVASVTSVANTRRTVDFTGSQWEHADTSPGV